MAEKILLLFPNHEISYADALKAFEELRKQAADLPEMSLDEINAEIVAVRADRKSRLKKLLQ